MLLINVGFFLVCNLPSCILSVSELVYAMPWYYRKHSYIPSEIPAWLHIIGHFSSFLQVLYASMGFLIYCLTCKDFTDELERQLQKLASFCPFRRPGPNDIKLFTIVI
jgi:hypothetical protein